MKEQETKDIRRKLHHLIDAIFDDNAGKNKALSEEQAIFYTGIPYTSDHAPDTEGILVVIDRARLASFAGLAKKIDDFEKSAPENIARIVKGQMLSAGNGEDIYAIAVSAFPKCLNGHIAPDAPRSMTFCDKAFLNELLDDIEENESEVGTETGWEISVSEGNVYFEAQESSSASVISFGIPIDDIISATIGINPYAKDTEKETPKV